MTLQMLFRFLQRNFSIWWFMKEDPILFCFTQIWIIISSVCSEINTTGEAESSLNVSWKSSSTSHSQMMVSTPTTPTFLLDYIFMFLGRAKCLQNLDKRKKHRNKLKRTCCTEKDYIIDYYSIRQFFWKFSILILIEEIWII